MAWLYSLSVECFDEIAAQSVAQCFAPLSPILLADKEFVLSPHVYQDDSDQIGWWCSIFIKPSSNLQNDEQALALALLSRLGSWMYEHLKIADLAFRYAL